MSPNMHLSARLRRILMFLLICLTASQLAGPYPQKAYAGAGGLETGECTPTCFGQCVQPTLSVGGAPDSFTRGVWIVSSNPPIPPLAMNTPRAFFASTALQFDDQIPSAISGQPACTPLLPLLRYGLVTGGIVDHQGDVTNTTELFGPVKPAMPSDINTELFFPGFDSGSLPTMIAPRALHQATLFSFAINTSASQFSATGKVLITGGSSDLQSARHSTSALSSAEIFNFNLGFLPDDDLSSLDSFAATANMNAARTLHQATLLDPVSGKVLITGGLNEKRQALSTAEIFDPNGGPLGTGAFTFTKGKMKHARFGHTATLLNDGTVLITGGSSSGEAYPYLNGRAGVTAGAELYNPKSDSFTEVGRMQVARVGHTASRIANTSNVLIAGGISGGIVTNTAELYNSSTKTFSRVGNMNYPRFLHSAASFSSGQVVIVGGSSDPKLQTSLNTRELFDGVSTFVKANPATDPVMSVTRRGFAAGQDIPIEDSNYVVLPGGLDSTGTPQSNADIYFPPLP
jgi:hypothetical protein